MELENELNIRIEALEVRNAFQDDVIEKLNQELSVHQTEITELKQQLTLIANKIKENTPTQSLTEEVEPPPPHY